MNRQQREAIGAVITQWKQAANEATTADASATYLECVDDLMVAFALKNHRAVCEGCATEIQILTANNKVNPDPPAGWSQMGRSKQGAGLLALWCPACRRVRLSASLPPRKDK